MILAPLRGVTIRCFRETFAEAIREAGFDEAVTPFITAQAGYDPLKDRELIGQSAISPMGLRLTPQFIGKDPEALRTCLKRVREAGFETADLNAGCPFPMVRNKGRGSGLLRTPDVLCRLAEVGCEVMGPARFSIKTRLGVERSDELLGLLPRLNEFPLRFLTVHARTARQMYAGACERAAYEAIRAAAKVPLVANGDLDWRAGVGMVGRSFIRALASRPDVRELLVRYVDASRRELSGERPVLGHLKELLAYWQDIPGWSARWRLAKISCSIDEILSII